MNGSVAPRIKGVLSPVVTPFKLDYSPDAERFVRHCQWLLSNKVGLAVFGTNSEGNSLSADERLVLLAELIEAGADPSHIMPGTGCTSISDSVRLSYNAVKWGCAGVLMLPPFYYKNVSDEGLYRNYAQIIEKVGDAKLRIYLYQIPSVSQVGISLSLIERLLKAYPTTVVGIKDTSGDWTYSKSVLDAFSADGFDVFAGTETTLLATMRGGGAGCISATANVNPAAIRTLYETWQSPDADEQQERLNSIRQVFQKYPMIPALKQAIARWSSDPSWARLRPPLVELSRDEATSLIAALEQQGFQMLGL